jgi:glycosyltransferase involved in cell wall biosynthesis/predicted SAM-dependent methyltransferase
VNALARFGRRQGARTNIRIYALASEVQDARVAVVSDAGSLAVDAHFLESDIILYHFGIYNPLFDSIHLAPSAAKTFVCYYGITPPCLVPESQRGVIHDSYRQAFNMHAADRIMTTSRYLVDELVRLGVPHSKVVQIPLGASFDSAPEIERGRVSLTPSFVCVGRFVPSKGQLDLVQAFKAHVGSDGQGGRLELIGSRRFSDQAYLERLQSFVVEHGLESLVRFRFDVTEKELREAIAAADALVIPSYHEGFCVPVIEAMMGGCFVICSNAGALPETSGGLGLTFTPGKVEELAACLAGFAASRRQGRFATVSGSLPETEWRERAAKHVSAYTRSTCETAFCSALLGKLEKVDEEILRGLGQARRNLITGLRGLELKPPEITSIQERIHAVLESVSEQEPVAVPRGGSGESTSATSGLPEVVSASDATANGKQHAPMVLQETRMITSLHDNGNARSRNSHLPALPSAPVRPIRQRLRAIPLVGKALRYVRRAVYLPWNFQKLSDAFYPSQAALQDQNHLLAAFGREALHYVQALAKQLQDNQAALTRDLLALRDEYREGRNLLHHEIALGRQTVTKRTGEMQIALKESLRENVATLAEGIKEHRLLLDKLTRDVPEMSKEERASRATLREVLLETLPEITKDLRGLKEQQIQSYGPIADEMRECKERVQQLASNQHGTTEWLSLLQRKFDMLALDVRERVPCQPSPAEYPEPRIVNAAAYKGLLIHMEGRIRVNLGCGEKPLPEYLNVDFRELPHVDVVADVHRLPFETGSLHEIASAHLVEHFREHHLTSVLLPYWRGLLRPDGFLRIVCPDWGGMLRRLQGGTMSLADFKTVTFGLQDYTGDDHFSMYTAETLSAALRQAGFTTIEVVALDRRNGMCSEMELVAKTLAD